MDLIPTALYTKHHTEGYLVYSPWFEQSFIDKYNNIKNYTVVKEDRCYIIEKMVQHCMVLEGDLAECGTYKGGTAHLIAETLKKGKAHKELHLFDTFSGMPDLANHDPSGHIEGDFGDTSLISVQAYLKSFENIIYQKGVIPETFNSDDIRKKTFSFVHIDVDLYQTVKDCCHFFYERTVSNGILLFDDYGFRKYEFAAKKAVDEFFSDKSEIPITLPTGQCLVIKH